MLNENEDKQQEPQEAKVQQEQIQDTAPQEQVPVAEQAKEPAEEDKPVEAVEAEVTEEADKKEPEATDVVATEPEIKKPEAEVPEEVHGETEEEEPVETPTETAELKGAEDIEALKKEVEDLRAEQAEEQAAQQFEAQRVSLVNEFDMTCVKLGNALAEEFKKYGIDTSKSIEEIEQEDPAKASIARGLVQQAERIREEQKAKVNDILNNSFIDMVFNKAARLFDKYQMTDEQKGVAATTFIDILEGSGIKDMAGDLMAKVELAVAKAKMAAPHVEKAVDHIKEAVKETTGAVEEAKKVVEIAQQEVETKPEEVPVEEEKPVEAPKPVPEVKPVDVSDFEAGAVASTVSANPTIYTEDNILDKLAALPARERVAFMKEHFDLINRASAALSAKIAERRKFS